MITETLKNLKTFGKGKWIAFSSFYNDKKNYKKNCEAIVKLCKNTNLCLKRFDAAEHFLLDSDMCFFVDNSNHVQIASNVRGKYYMIRGIADGIEQNIPEEFYEQSLSILDNFTVDSSADWRKQIEWISRLRKTNKLFDKKEYNKIDIQQVIEDISYNGYSLHYKTNHKPDKIYYPYAKRELLTKPMLRPMIANHLNCRTNEIFVGKYNGNGKGLKYIIGDLVSTIDFEKSSIQKIYGSVKFKNYKDDILKVPADYISVGNGGEFSFELYETLNTCCIVIESDNDNI